MRAEHALPTTQDIAGEFQFRIQGDIDHFGGSLPERNAIVWRACLAALLEWNVIPIAQHDDLVAQIPPVHDDRQSRSCAGASRLWRKGTELRVKSEEFFREALVEHQRGGIEVMARARNQCLRISIALMQDPSLP